MSEPQQLLRASEPSGDSGGQDLREVRTEKAPRIFYEDEAVTLWLGDCLDVLPTLPDESIALVLTDPPYNVSEFNGRDNTTIGKVRRADGSYREIRKDFGQWDRDFDPAWLLAESERVLDADGGFLAFTSDVLCPAYISTQRMTHRRLCVWHKTNAQPVFRGVGYQQSTEFIEWRTKGKATFYGGGAEPNVFAGPKLQSQVHPTQKPDWLIAKLIALHSQEGETVLDPFAGSGTTGVAAKLNGRKAVLIEREERYCAVAAKRLRETQPGRLFDALPRAKPQSLLPRDEPKTDPARIKAVGQGKA